MIAERHNDHMVMAISGHSSTRMLERYTHPTESSKIDGARVDRAGVPRHKLATNGDSGLCTRETRDRNLAFFGALYVGLPAEARSGRGRSAVAPVRSRGYGGTAFACDHERAGLPAEARSGRESVRLRPGAISTGYGGQPSRAFMSEGWWTAQGSNLRPPRCERGALPAELAAHSVGHLSAKPTGFVMLARPSKSRNAPVRLASNCVPEPPAWSRRPRAVAIGTRARLDQVSATARFGEHPVSLPAGAITVPLPRFHP